MLLQHEIERGAEKGISTLQVVGRIAREHQEKLLTALSPEEQRQLADLLKRVAAQQRLLKGVHPGFRAIGTRPSDKM